MGEIAGQKQKMGEISDKNDKARDEEVKLD